MTNKISAFPIPPERKYLNGLEIVDGMKNKKRLKFQSRNENLDNLTKLNGQQNGLKNGKTD